MTYGTHLKRSRHGTLYFRFVVPADVRAIMGSAEISLSLGTASSRGAEVTALELRLTAKRLVEAARESIRMNEPIKLNLAALNVVIQKQRHKALLGELADVEQAHREVVADSEAKSALINKLTVAMLGRPGAPPSASASPTLSEAIQAFKTERLTTGNWSQKTADSWDSRLRLPVEWFGDVPLSTLSREDMTGFLAALRKLPKNATKYKALHGMTMPALVEAAGYECIASTTVNQIMDNLSALFSWLVTDRAKWGVSGNLAQDLRLSNIEGIARVAFDGDDLRAMFASPEWVSRQFLHSYGYWLLSLGLFTGARINELCQIDLKDFSEAGGHPVLSLCAEGLRFKNKNARRAIPVHPELVRLGLLRHVQRLREAGEMKLFPECVAKRDGHGQDASRWFGKFKHRAGIADVRKVFHSTRHSFTSQLLNAGVDEATGVAPLVGHARGGESSSTYWNERDIQRFVGIVKILEYPVVTELMPIVEDVQFGIDVHRSARRPPPRKSAPSRRKLAAPRIS